MKKAIFTICALSLAHLGLSAQEEQGVIPSLVGWSYYGGDEFNGTSIGSVLKPSCKPILLSTQFHKPI